MITVRVDEKLIPTHMRESSHTMGSETQARRLAGPQLPHGPMANWAHSELRSRTQKALDVGTAGFWPEAATAIPALQPSVIPPSFTLMPSASPPPGALWSGVRSMCAMYAGWTEMVTHRIR